MSDVRVKWTKHVNERLPLGVDFTDQLNPSLTLSSGAAIAITSIPSTREPSPTLTATVAINGSTFTDRSTSGDTIEANHGVIITWTGDGTSSIPYECIVTVTDSDGVPLAVTVEVEVTK